MALVRCVLGKFLGVVCHCFPLPLDVPTFATGCLHVPINTSARSSERWNYRARNGRLILAVTHVITGFFNMPQICDLGKKALLPFRRKTRWGFFRPRTRVPEASMLTTKPPKPIWESNIISVIREVRCGSVNRTKPVQKVFSWTRHCTVWSPKSGTLLDHKFRFRSLHV
jgi:hypothetical protein